MYDEKKHYVVAEGPVYTFLMLIVTYLFTTLLFFAPPCKQHSKESCGVGV